LSASPSKVIDERDGKARSSIGFFFEDYFFRNFGHLAKYNLRCFVHSLVKHKDMGDRRAELFALLVGLHHPELYSIQMSCVFMRLIRGLFPDHKSIRPLLDKYDGKTKASNCLVARKLCFAAILGPKGRPNKPSTWDAPELMHLTDTDEMQRGVVLKVARLPAQDKYDPKKMTDIDGVLYLMIDYFVIAAIRMQMRLKNFFVVIISTYNSHSDLCK